MKKLAQKSAVSIVKFQPPLPEVIRQSKEVQKLKKEKATIIRAFSALMKRSLRDQQWCVEASEWVSDARVWKKKSETVFEPWRVEAHQAHKLVTSTMEEFISSVDSMARATEGARVAAVLKAQADMRLRQANLDADAEKANAQRPEEEQAPAALVAPEIEGKVGRKIWCVDRESFEIKEFLQAFRECQISYDTASAWLLPNFTAMDAHCSSTRESTDIPGAVAGYKLAGTDLFVPNPVKK